ncbi:hypothetical protein ACHAWF_005956 [Thalassiosira exigua]
MTITIDAALTSPSEVGIRPPVILGALLLLLPAAWGFSLPPPSPHAPLPRRLHGRVGQHPFLCLAPSPPSLLPAAAAVNRPPDHAPAQPVRRLGRQPPLVVPWYGGLAVPLDEESVEVCLEELADSEYGKTMFGRHDVPRRWARFVESNPSDFRPPIPRPDPIRRFSLDAKTPQPVTCAETVLSKAAQYLKARIPKIVSVRVSFPSDLSDFEEVINEFTGEVLYVEDKSSPDFNGDWETMEYQRLDPDVRGPFVFGKGRGMMRPT